MAIVTTTYRYKPPPKRRHKHILGSLRFLLPAGFAMAVTPMLTPSPTLAAGDRVITIEEYCANCMGPGAQYVNAANSAEFATIWLPSFARLAATIPALSPREEQWLADEERASFERGMRAHQSHEYALKRARQKAVALEGVLRIITVEQDSAVLIRRGLEFISELVRDDISSYLARLVAEKMITSEGLPDGWEDYRKDSNFESIRMTIIWRRDDLINDVLTCTLPSLGIGNILLPIPNPG